jgi:hypothetical protein
VAFHALHLDDLLAGALGGLRRRSKGEGGETGEEDFHGDPPVGVRVPSRE